MTRADGECRRESHVLARSRKRRAHLAHGLAQPRTTNKTRIMSRPVTFSTSPPLPEHSTPWPLQQRVNSNWGRAEASECANRATTRVFFVMRTNEHTTGMRVCAEAPNQCRRVCPSAATGPAADRGSNAVQRAAIVSAGHVVSVLLFATRLQQKWN